ncbi:MAG: c-type cytochrome [Pseudomonadota bacterium]|uniref:c-type cytochrome n=1 Tax=Phenylobacterium sp. TaxID=1871053 RepID=UPI0025F6FA46|nr:c-type cytochrome [Phenylobacterium sp.]MBT9473158.1 c-type cytochrome [Phenylobacterium sp.]
MRRLLLLSAGLLMAAGAAWAADPPPPPEGAAAQGGRGGGAAGRAQSTREFLGLGVEPDAVAAARGKPLYEAQCAACHGATARGGMGPSLIHSSVVLDDDHGEKLTPFLKTGRPERGMPSFGTLSDRDLTDVTEYLHHEVESVANRGTYENTNNILVGDKKMGAAFVQRNCAACHSVTGDLKGIGAKYRPLDLQRNWIFPPRDPADGPRAFQAVVTSPQGRFEGRVRQVDDFRIVIVDAAGAVRPFARTKAVKVEIKDPLAAHGELARTLKDQDMSNVTTYLETLK